MSRDFAGSPIYEVECSDGITRFIPYNLDTIFEYIKVKEEEKDDERERSGAV